MRRSVSEIGYYGCEECQVYRGVVVIILGSGKAFQLCRRCLDVLRDQLKKALKEQDQLTAEWRKRQQRKCDKGLDKQGEG